MNSDNPADNQNKDKAHAPLRTRLRRGLWTGLTIITAGVVTALVVYWQGWLEPEQTAQGSTPDANLQRVTPSLPPPPPPLTATVTRPPSPPLPPAAPMPSSTAGKSGTPPEPPATPEQTSSEPVSAAPGAVIAQDAALVLSLAVLIRAADKPGSFSDELTSLEKFMTNNGRSTEETSLLARLNATARTGAPTDAMLRAGFNRIVPDILQAAREEADDDATGEKSWIARQLARFIIIRPTGMTAGKDTDAIVARMEVHLEDGNLEGAVSEGANLRGAAATVAAPWLDEAQARLHLDRQIDTLATRALASLAPSHSSRTGAGTFEER